MLVYKVDMNIYGEIQVNIEAVLCTHVCVTTVHELSCFILVTGFKMTKTAVFAVSRPGQ